MTLDLTEAEQEWITVLLQKLNTAQRDFEVAFASALRARGFTQGRFVRLTERTLEVEETA